jgi:ferredoxin-NADP reductase
LHAHARVGTVLALSAAAGEFVLPATIPGRLLLLGAGSGVTPLMAMLDDLRHRGHAGPVTFVYSCRDEPSTIFAGALRAAAQAMPNLTLHIHHVASSGRLDEHGLGGLVADFTGYETYLCGPDGFMRWVDAAFRGQGRESALHSERFGLAAPAREAGAARIVHCTTSNKQFVADGATPLLQAAESAGLQPVYGCRAGICRSCLCRKTSGRVENLITGLVSDEPDQWIQLCISAARSDVALEL